MTAAIKVVNKPLVEPKRRGWPKGKPRGPRKVKRMGRPKGSTNKAKATPAVDATQTIAAAYGLLIAGTNLLSQLFQTK